MIQSHVLAEVLVLLCLSFAVLFALSKRQYAGTPQENLIALVIHLFLEIQLSLKTIRRLLKKIKVTNIYSVLKLLIC